MKRFATGAGLAALFAASATPALAVEGGLDAYAKGFAGFMAGVVPPDQGLYLTNIFYYASGSAGAEVRGGNIELNADVNLALDMVEGVYVTDYHPLGATFAFGGAVGYAWGALDATVQTPLGSRSISPNAANISDSLIAPFLLGWNQGNFHWNVAMFIYAPSGPYQTDRLSIGKNIWGFMPQVAATYFDPKSGLDISGTLVFVTTTNNSATQYQSGDVLHFDWAAGMHFGAQSEWEAGIVGNLVQQVSGDSGPGAKLGSFEEASFGVGLGGTYSTLIGTTPANFGVRWERDIDATNTFKGDIVMATATVKF